MLLEPIIQNVKIFSQSFATDPNPILDQSLKKKKKKKVLFVAINDEESNSMEGKLLLKFHEKEGLELLTQRRP